jgi:hypothetical protein
VERCIGCHYYDRGKIRASDQGSLRWGQCRRTAPALSPINAKASMIEGVWPTVRDDDWCGEWKVLTRQPRRSERMSEDTAIAAAGSKPTPPQPPEAYRGHLMPAIEALADLLPFAAAPAGDD